MSEEIKMTAVDWLVKKFMTENTTREGWHEIFNQAKQMEKEQIIEARQDGHDSTHAEYGETPKCYLDGSNEQYYNQTYKNK
jgi:hypothetical protein